MSSHNDPAIALAAAALQQTLDRMGEKMNEIEARHCRMDLDATLITVRVPPQMQRAIARYMRQTGLRNQSEAVRRMLEAGAKALQLEGEVA